MRGVPYKDAERNAYECPDCGAEANEPCTITRKDGREVPGYRRYLHRNRVKAEEWWKSKPLRREGRALRGRNATGVVARRAERPLRPRPRHRHTA